MHQERLYIENCNLMKTYEKGNIDVILKMIITGINDVIKCRPTGLSMVIIVIPVLGMYTITLILW